MQQEQECLIEENPVETCAEGVVWRRIAGQVAVVGLIATLCAALFYVVPFGQRGAEPVVNYQKLTPNTTVNLGTSRGWCVAVRDGVVAVGQPLVSAPCSPTQPEQRLYTEGGKIIWLTHPELCGSVGPPFGSHFSLVMDLCRPGFALQALQGLCIGSSQQGAFNVPIIVHACPGVAQAAAQSVSYAGVDLFCWMAVLPGSFEEVLVRLAAQKSASIFACESHKVYLSSPSLLVQQGSWVSWANRDSFVKVWQHLIVDGQWRKSAWTVKVDPDAVWVPSRLRPILGGFHIHTDAAVYVKNTRKDFGFLGPIEILSKAAVAVLLATYQQCSLTAGDAAMGEDGWLKGCLDQAGVTALSNQEILSASDDTNTCWDHSHVAYHAFKDPGAWEECWTRVG